MPRVLGLILTAFFASSIVVAEEASKPREPEPSCLSPGDAGNVERDGNRLYKADGKSFPWKCKCSEYDYRTLHLCIEARFFDPSARIYFDTGDDNAGEVDVFNDGGLNPSIDFIAVYIPWRLGRAEYFDSWSWGPMGGVGISSAAQDSENGTNEASDAPVVLVSGGFLLEYKFESGPSFGFEIGKAIGFTSDESIGNIDDDATYVGLKINIPIKSAKDKDKGEEK